MMTSAGGTDHVKDPAALVWGWWGGGGPGLAENRNNDSQLLACKGCYTIPLLILLYKFKTIENT